MLSAKSVVQTIKSITPKELFHSTNRQIPRRGIYSTDEAALNDANYNEAVTRMSNGDSFLSKVWWDKR